MEDRTVMIVGNDKVGVSVDFVGADQDKLLFRVALGDDEPVAFDPVQFDNFYELIEQVHRFYSELIYREVRAKEEAAEKETKQGENPAPEVPVAVGPNYPASSENTAE